VISIKNEKGWECVEYSRWTEGGQLYETFVFRDPENQMLHEAECFRLQTHLPGVHVHVNLDDSQQKLPGVDEKKDG